MMRSKEQLRISLAAERGLIRSPRQFRFRFRLLFDGVDLKGKSVLDVGAGHGPMALYASCMGANPTICLESEASGSQPAVSRHFRVLAQALDLRPSLASSTFQGLDPRGLKFNLVLMHASVSHLD